MEKNNKSLMEKLLSFLGGGYFFYKKKLLDRTNLSEKDKFIYFYEKLINPNSLIGSQASKLYEYNLTNEEKIDLLSYKPELFNLLSDSDKNDKTIIEGLRVKLKDREIKDIYDSLKKSSQLCNAFFNENSFDISWLNVLDSADLIKFSSKIVSSFRVDDFSLFTSLLNKNLINEIYLILEENVKKKYMTFNDVANIYEAYVKKEIEYDYNISEQKKEKLKEISTLFFKIEDLCNEVYNEKRTLVPYLIKEVKSFEDKNFKDKDFENECLNRMLRLANVDYPLGKNKLIDIDSLVKYIPENPNVLFLVELNYANKYKISKAMEYVKVSNNIELKYWMAKHLFYSSHKGGVEKSIIDELIEYRKSDSFNSKLGNLEFRASISSDIETVLFNGFNNFYEMYVYLYQNDFLEKRFFWEKLNCIAFSHLEQDNERKLKIKSFFLENSKSLSDEVNMEGTIEIKDLVENLFRDLRNIPDNDIYENFKQQIFLRLIEKNKTNIVFVKNLEDGVKNKCEKSIEDIKDELKTKTFKGVGAVNYIEMLLNDEVFKSLDINDSSDLELIARSANENLNVYKKIEENLKNNKKFIDIWFNLYADNQVDLEVNVVFNFNKSLFELKHVEQLLTRKCDSWILKLFYEKNKCIFENDQYDEFVNIVKYYTLNKTFSFGSVDQIEGLNKDDFFTKEFVEEIINSKKGIINLITYSGLEKNLIKENWNLFLEHSRELNFFDSGKLVFFRNSLGISNSIDRDVYKEILSEDIRSSKEYMGLVNVSIERVIEFLDVANEFDKSQLLFKAVIKDGESLFDMCMENKKFFIFMKEQYGEKEAIKNLCEEDINFLNTIVSDYENKVMKKEMLINKKQDNSTGQETDEVVIKVKPMQKRVKKF